MVQKVGLAPRLVCHLYTINSTYYYCLLVKKRSQKGKYTYENGVIGRALNGSTYTAIYGKLYNSYIDSLLLLVVPICL